MGNHPQRAYRDEKGVRIGDKNYSKRDLLLIQQRLKEKEHGLKSSKSSNSLTRSQQLTQIKDLETHYPTSAHYQSSQKSRNITPSASHGKTASMGGLDLAYPTKSFDFTNKAMSSSMNSTSSAGGKKQNIQQNIAIGSLPGGSYSNNPALQNRLQTIVQSKHRPTLDVAGSYDSKAPDYFQFSPKTSNLIDQLLEQRDGIDELDNNLLLESYYRKGTSIDQIRKFSQSSSSSATESVDSPSKSSTANNEKTEQNFDKTKKNRFAIRMQRHMQTSHMFSKDSNDDSSSSHSTYGNGLSNYKKQGNIPETFDFDNLNFTHIPAMSTDGMYAQNDNNEKHTTVTTEPEEEDLVLDQGADYKLSIMKRKRPLPPDVQKQQDEVEKKMIEQNGISMKGNKGTLWPVFSPKVAESKEEEDKGTDSEEAEIKLRKTNDQEFRKRLMIKLSQNGMIDPAGVDRPQSHQTIIIWDWDDTLMASTQLSPYQSQILKPQIRKKLSKQIQQQLDQLEDLVIKLMKKSVKQGKTYIITNAGQGWVELSSARFLPKLYKELIMNSQKNGINIISARSLFEKEMPNAFKEWKFKTFTAIGNYMDKDILTNIVAVGDSQIEIDAATSLSQYIITFYKFYRQFAMSCVKTIKLKEQPNILELIRQVELIQNQLEEIVNCAKNLTIRLQKVQEENAAAVNGGADANKQQ